MAVPPAAGDPWWWPHGASPGTRPVLFFPSSGAEPSSLRPLVAHTAGLRFGVAQLPGRGSRHAEAAPTDLAAVIGEFAAAVARLDGPPPVLVGHSFGGLLAYGVVSALERRGAGVGRLLTVASASPGSWTAQLQADRVAYPGESRADFVQRRTALILAGGGVPAGLLEHPEFAARAQQLLETDVGLSHEGFVPSCVTTPVTAVVARDDTVIGPHAHEGWAEVAAGPFERRDVPGGHFFYRRTPQRLSALLRIEVQVLDGDYELL